MPNIVGYVRLAGIPVFLYLALSSGDGRTLAASAIFFAIAAGDYLDGFLARATGQYSRLGALLDPVIDRLTVLAGVIVCWRFELLPRWALVVLAARELVTLVLGEIALRRGIDIEINWVGRVAVLLTMGGIFWTLALDSWVGPALFLIGLALTVFATVLNIKAALRQTRQA